MFSVLVIRLRSLRLLRVSGIVMRLRMFLLLITFLKASHSFRNRLLVICKNAYRSEERFSRNAETELVCRLLLEKKKDRFIGGTISKEMSRCYVLSRCGHRNGTVVPLPDCQPDSGKSRTHPRSPVLVRN